MNLGGGVVLLFASRAIEQAREIQSLLFAIGEPPPYVMAQMGHTTASLTLTIYARQMDRRDGESERLKALVEGHGQRHLHPSQERRSVARRRRTHALGDRAERAGGSPGPP